MPRGRARFRALRRTCHRRRRCRSPPPVATSAFAREAGVTLTPVPFDGGAPAVAAAVGSQVDAVVAGAGEVAQANTDGTLRALAVFNDEAHPLMPDVPTAAEAGYDLEIGGWGGTYAPAVLPDDVKTILGDAIEQAATSAEFTEVISNAGSLPVYTSPADFGTFVNDEYTRFAELLAD
ncbi:MAG: tripartite tricarboxylate transporter substrate-binding protein [Cellulomonadaceae bacterium]